MFFAGEDELIDLTNDDPTIWRDIVRTLITMFKARTAGSSNGGAGGSTCGVPSSSHHPVAREVGYDRPFP